MFCKVIDMKGSWLFSWRGEGIEPIQPKLGGEGFIIHNRLLHLFVEV